MKDCLERMIEKYQTRLYWLEEEVEKQLDERAKGVYEGMSFYSRDFIKDLQLAKELLKDFQEAQDFLEDLKQLKQCS